MPVKMWWSMQVWRKVFCLKMSWIRDHEIIILHTRQSVSSHHKDFMRDIIKEECSYAVNAKMSACVQRNSVPSTTNAIFICQDKEARWFKVQISTECPIYTYIIYIMILSKIFMHFSWSSEAVKIEFRDTPVYNRRKSIGNEIWIIVQTYYEIYVDTLFVYIWNLCFMKICSQYLTSFSLSTTICKLIILNVEQQIIVILVRN